MFKISENASVNYLAKIVQLGKPVPHENAQKLQGFIIDHNRVWTDMSYKEGDICVFFPIECCINPELLSYLNLFRDKTLNADKEKSGFFEYHGRVRALKLRGLPSEGFLLPIKQVVYGMGSILENPATELKWVGTEFNIILINNEEKWICKKYIPKGTKTQGVFGSNTAKKKIIDLILDGQFHLMRDTEQLKRHIEEVKPEDIISCSYKLHGTSFVASNILVKRILSPVERLLKFFGIKVQESKYGSVYSSRKVIKDVDGKTLSTGGFYGTDIWGIVHEEVKDKVLQGYSLYGEIVGYIPTGEMIQSGYDYGCGYGQHDFYVYRITYTNPEGHVHELDWQSLKDYCDKFGLKYVPELHFGKASEVISWVDVEDSNWNDLFLQELQNLYLEKDCHMCTNKVPAEGIVLRIEKGDRTAYKLKSWRFLGMESEQLDKGTVDIETEN